MKKNGIKNKLLIMFCIFSLTAITIGCNKEPVNEQPYSDEEIALIGKRHNEGLDIILGAFETSDIAKKYHHKKSANVALTTQDKLEIARFLDVQAKEFISNNPLTYKGEEVAIDPIEFSDEQLLDFYNTEIDADLTTELQLKYFTLLEDAHYNKQGSDLTFVAEIDRIISDANVEIADESELIPVLTMGSVLKYSNNYWHSDLKAKGWLSIALADATNGGSAALWGAAVAGPLGAVVVGLNGAIIGSCTAYLISEI
ncbi:MAG: hypothetical protein P1P82_01680 [Bacteroidales bacterium]|nr:hypothetical protein [Bacteroidales bacterium]MDT8430255.1 hypothetical protein [Bacteroidales bacterium]